MTDTAYFEKRLTEDRDRLKQELEQLGQQQGEAGVWEAKATDLDIMEADENEAADRIEELHIDQIVLDELAIRYRQIERALSRIEAGTYGTCEVCSAPIETERLHANPAARTCKAHMSSESELPL